MDPQLRIVRLANAQFGVVTRAQLLAAGLSATEVRSRVRGAWLIAVHRGVYRVGHAAPSVAASYFAAWLACGEGALLAGLAAAWWLGLVRGTAPRPEVACPRERRVPGVLVRHCRGLGVEDGREWRGVPTTTPARTLTDLAARLPREALARACHEAGVLHRTTPEQVRAALERRPRLPGAAALRAVMTGEEPVTLSALERRFLERVSAARLPPPQTNRVASGRRVDCRWPERRLTVELDSFGFHNSRHSWERDRRREREAYARGDQLRRYTYGDVFEDPRRMLAELRELLA